MNQRNARLACKQPESAMVHQCSGVWLLADVLPELLARYQLSDDELAEEGWIDPILTGEPVTCGD
jgi:hypothetical protein